MLKCLAELPFEPHSYQVATADKIIKQMECRALVADEVGLGKTIEAGLVVKELINSGCKKILILVPATLAYQWTHELYEKFGLNFYFCRKGNWGWDYEFVVASLDRAKQAEHQKRILENNYDLVIIDEAHKLKNRNTENWKFISRIKTKGLLLLTATPLQNKVEEVYNLISLLKPAEFNNYQNFLQHYQLSPDSMIHDMKEKLQDIMIRNVSAETGIIKADRKVHLTTLELLPQEKLLYQAIQSLPEGLLTLTLTKEFCSSLAALFGTVRKLKLDSLLPMLQQVLLEQKLTKVKEIINDHPGKVLIFTEYLYTQFYLAHNLDKLEVKTLLYNGRMRQNQKAYIKELFDGPQYRAMICTDSGSQGLNLQTCDVIINYDLPWNPMKVEQRIGRIDRIGQASKEISIYNFVLKDTLEERIFFVLAEKIGLFKACIGNLDKILADNDEMLKEVMAKF